MIKGLDSAESLIPFADRLAASGFQFAIRYVSQNSTAHPTKRITAAEVSALHALGLKVGLVWEVSDDVRTLTRQAGLVHASAAIQNIRGLNAPAGTACFFAADTDAQPALVEAYFVAVHEAFAKTGFLVGVYGSQAVCEYLKSEGLAHYGWLAQSTGWTGFVAQGQPIWQEMETAPLGIDGDVCGASDLAGLF